MKKCLLFITGLLFALAFTPTPSAHAQDDIFCIEDMFANDFECAEAGVSNFCDSSRVQSVNSIYHDSYCNITRDTDDDIDAIVATQFDIKDPDVVKDILNLEFRDYSLLPDGLKSYSLAELTNRVTEAYEKEKVLHYMRESLKQEFEVSEQWYNATLLDSPVDLVADLNLIDIKIFGSQAKWNEDVYSFPSGDAEEGAGATPGVGQITSEPGDTSSETGDSSGEEPQGPPLFNVEEDCVPPNHPDAEPPDPAEVPALCGNNKLETGEECDDDNNESGDGCSNTCILESAGSLLCQDPEAVTFQKFESSRTTRSDEISVEADDTPLLCPPGTRPKHNPEATKQPSYPQSAGYPGPDTGGRLKAFPPSNKPACPSGYSQLEFDYLNLGEGTMDEADTPICIPTKLCGDINAACQFLFDQDCETASKELGFSLEALFCVEVKKENRPLSPYALNEGCIDCHIRAMVEILDELLVKNVAPLENTMSAYSISNRWGPQFSFDLNTAVKPDTKISELAKVPSAIKQANEEMEKLRNAWKDIKAPDIVREGDAVALLQQYQALEAKKEQQYFEKLKNYRVNTYPVKDTQFAGRVGKLLDQWSESFAHIQDVYIAIAEATNFRNKKLCEF
ncbi:MAG: hypothetical protein V1760_03330 [Candidatus Peregrinibacteria bacterium]